MKVKELVEKLSKLKDDTEVKIGYGDKEEPINFIMSENNCIVLHPDVYGSDEVEVWNQTMVRFFKK